MFSDVIEIMETDALTELFFYRDCDRADLSDCEAQNKISIFSGH